MNQNNTLMARISVLAALMGMTNAAIAENGLWTGNDWYDSANKVGVTNGVLYSSDSAVNRRL